MRKNNNRSLLLLALCLAACGGSGNSLSGSIGGTVPLGFDTVSLRLEGGAISLAYLRSDGGVTAHLVYSPPPSPPIQAAQVLMLDFSLHGNAALSRATADMLQFPQPQGGTLSFDQALAAPAGAMPGMTLSGHFGVQFTGGQTLSGAFSAPLQVAAE